LWRSPVRRKSAFGCVCQSCYPIWVRPDDLRSRAGASFLFQCSLTCNLLLKPGWRKRAQTLPCRHGKPRRLAGRRRFSQEIAIGGERPVDAFAGKWEVHKASSTAVRDRRPSEMGLQRGTRIKGVLAIERCLAWSKPGPPRLTRIVDDAAARARIWTDCSRA
jgi:hypothetical protein